MQQNRPLPTENREGESKNCVLKYCTISTKRMLSDFDQDTNIVCATLRSMRLSVASADGTSPFLMLSER